MSQQRRAAEALMSYKLAKAFKLVEYGHRTRKNDKLIATVVRMCGIVIDESVKTKPLTEALDDLAAFADSLAPKGYGASTVIPLSVYGGKCRKCDGVGWTHPLGVKDVRPKKVPCVMCNGEGYVE